jgi:hypothetical protein
MPHPVITLTSDFGPGAYVAQLRGVILGICEHAQIVDLSHEIPPHEILRATLALEDVVATFPPGTIHVCVVDPGVGTERRAVVVRGGPRAAGHVFVGPDNGVFSPFIQDGQVFRIINANLMRLPVSATFHGRDVFAPVAAHLASGTAIEDVGPEIGDPVWLSVPRARRASERETFGEVLYADRFGNLVSNIAAVDLPAGPADALDVQIAGHRVQGLLRTYGDAPLQELLALVGSSGRLEIAVREGSAARRLFPKGTPGESVRVWAGGG